MEAKANDASADANANHHHKAPSPVAVRIADKLHDVVRQESKGAEPCLLMIDNLQLERMGALMASGEASDMGDNSS